MKTIASFELQAKRLLCNCYFLRLTIDSTIIYPDAKVMSFLPRDLEPGEPTVMMGEEKRDEYGDIVGGPKISKKKKKENLAKNEKDEDHTTSTAESYVNETKNFSDMFRRKKPLGRDVRKNLSKK